MDLKFLTKLKPALSCLGVNSLSPFQEQVVARLMTKKSTLVAGEHGGGKSLSWALSAVAQISRGGPGAQGFKDTLSSLFCADARAGQTTGRHGALVIVPLREQIFSVYSMLRTLGGDLRVHRTSSMADLVSVTQYFKEPKITTKVLRKLGFVNMSKSVDWGLLDICIGVPKVIADVVKYQMHEKQLNIDPQLIVLEDIELLLLDKMYSDDVMFLLNRIGDISARQVILTTSYLKALKGVPNPYSSVTKNFVDMETMTSDTIHTISPSLRFDYSHTDSDDSNGMAYLLEIIRNSTAKKLIVFASYISRCIDIASELEDNGFSVSIVHSDLDIEERAENLLNFVHNKTRIAVGTDLLARALNQSVDHVVLYNIPQDYPGVMLRVGKTGMSGGSGRVSCIVRPGDEEIVTRLRPGGLLRDDSERRTRSRNVPEFHIEH